MPMRPSDPLKGPSRGTAADVVRWGNSFGMKRPQFTASYLYEGERLCELMGFDYAIWASQAALETGDPDRGLGFLSSIWEKKGVPAGLGVTDGADVSIPFPNTAEGGRRAAQAHTVHYALYNMGAAAVENSPLAEYIELDYRWDAAIRAGYAGVAKTLADLSGRWATGRDYAEVICNRSREIWPRLANASGERGGSTLEILQRLVGVQRNAPATKLTTGPRSAVPIVHNTDNPSRGADALMHAQFVANGGGQYNVSFHFANDDGRAVQILPLDRIAYHASDGCDSRADDVGCFNGIAIENCDNADGDIEQTFENLAELLACIEFGDPRIEYGGRPISDFEGFIDRTLGHHDTADDGKWCPSDFMNHYGENGWKSRLKTNAKARLAAKRGITPAPEPSDPPAPAIEYPEGIDKALASKWFGSLKQGGKIYQFTERGPVSMVWLEAGDYSPIVGREVYGTREYYRFAGGLVIWRPNASAPMRVLGAAE